jgi:MFS family permease
MTFNGQFFGAGPATSLVYFVQEFRVGYPEIAPLISYVVLMIGLGSLIWIPTASVFGKRIVLIVSNFIFLVGCIWCIYATSLNSLLGARILAGFGAGAVQAIGPAVIGGTLPMIVRYRLVNKVFLNFPKMCSSSATTPR